MNHRRSTSSVIPSTAGQPEAHNEGFDLHRSPHLYESPVGTPLLRHDTSRRVPIQESGGSRGLYLRSMALWAMLGGLVAGIAVALGNHVFFTHLSGRRSDVASQFWITAAKNVFPKIVQVVLGVSLTCGITQAVSAEALPHICMHAYPACFFSYGGSRLGITQVDAHTPFRSSITFSASRTS